MTLIELLVSMSVLGLLMATVLAVYLTGVGAWRKGGTRGELLQELQVANLKIVKDIEGTAFAGITIGPSNESISLLSLFNENGDFTLDDAGRPVWQKWNVYFRQGNLLRRREVPWSASEAVRSVPVPIENLTSGLTIGDYSVDGQVITRNLHDFKVSLVPDTTLISVKIHLARKVPRRDPEQVVLETSVVTRND